MDEILSNWTFGLLLFAAVLTFFSSFMFNIGEVYYGRPPIAGINELSQSNDINDKVVSPFVSSTQAAEMTGTGSYLAYAAIPQVLGALRTFFNLPQAMINLMTTIGKYLPLPTWFTEYFIQIVIVMVSFAVVVALINRGI